MLARILVFRMTGYSYEELEGSWDEFTDNAIWEPGSGALGHTIWVGRFIPVNMPPMGALGHTISLEVAM